MESGGTDGSGTNAGDKIVFDGDGAGVASDAEHFLRFQDADGDEGQPKFLTAAADGSGNSVGANVDEKHDDGNGFHGDTNIAGTVSNTAIDAALLVSDS